MNSPVRSKPVIFDFLDAAQFLNDVFDYRKAVDPSFSYTRWSIELGLGSKTALRFMLKRQRSISQKTLRAFCQNLGLDEQERDYFEALVAYSQAKTEKTRHALGAALIKLQRFRHPPADVRASDVANGALDPVVLTLLTYNDIAHSAENLSRLLQVSDKDVEEALSRLESHGVVKQQAGNYSFKGSQFRMPDALASAGLRRFHEYWIDRAKTAIDLPTELRRFRSLKFALNEEEFAEMLSRINDYAVSTMARFNQSSMQGRRLFMLETLLFAISDQVAEKAANRAENLSAM